jgi:hypothetical protein
MMWGVVGGRRMYGLFDAMHFNTLNAWFITLVGLGWWVHAAPTITALSIISHRQSLKYH